MPDTATEKVDLQISYKGSKSRTDRYPNVRFDATYQEMYDTARAIIALRNPDDYSTFSVYKIVSKEL